MSDFIHHYRIILAEVSTFCHEQMFACDDDMLRLFFKRTEFVTTKLEEKLEKTKINYKFTEIDLPIIFYICWLVSVMLLQIPGKKKSKKFVKQQLIDIINEFFSKEYVENAYLKANGFTKKYIANIAAKKLLIIHQYINQARHGYSGSYHVSVGVILEFYDILISFIIKCLPEMVNYIDETHNISILEYLSGTIQFIDLVSTYITEWPRSTCPHCGISSYPVINVRKFDTNHGYMMNCQFCGHDYGYGGKKKSLYHNGKRVLSTSWRVGKFEASACQFCGKSFMELAKYGLKAEAHHIIPISEGGEDIPSNIMILCPDCHEEAHRLRKQRQQGLDRIVN